MKLDPLHEALIQVEGAKAEINGVLKMATNWRSEFAPILTRLETISKCILDHQCANVGVAEEPKRKVTIRDDPEF